MHSLRLDEGWWSGSNQTLHICFLGASFPGTSVTGKVQYVDHLQDF